MMVAAVDGDPPFPPAHTPRVTFDPSNMCYKNESNPFDDWFLFDNELLGTAGYGATTVEDSNRRTNNHHDLPPQPQCRHSTTYIPIKLPPQQHDLKKLLDDIRRMCERVAPTEPTPPHSNNDNTTTTPPTTTPKTAPQAAPRVVPPPCSDTSACCTPSTTDATIPSLDAKHITTMTLTLPTADDDDDATTTMTDHTATISYDNDDTTMPPHDSTTHPHPTPDPEHPQTPYAHPSPRLSDSYDRVHQALDRLEHAIADMSNAVADLSARIAIALSTPPTPPRRPTLPSNGTQQLTSQSLPTGPLPNHRSLNMSPLPAPKPPFAHKTKLDTMRTQPHPSPSFRAMLLRMAKHNYRPP